MSDAVASTSSRPPRAFVRALSHALRPLVKLMLSRGVTFTFASELLKSLFVEVADRDFRIDDKPPTDSRVSLVSGVHRKEVSRLRQAMESGEETIPAVVSLGAQVVARWMGAPPYISRTGAPLPLARFASDGGDLSFEALVAQVNRDIRPRVVLDEWLRLGVVHIDEDGRVRLNVGAFVPTKGFDEMSFYLGHNLHDHAAAAAHNLLGGQPPFMERSVHYDGLGADTIAKLAEQANTLGMQALVAVNKNALASTKRARAETSQLQRMTFGIYFYAENMVPPATEPGSLAKKKAKGSK
ncbi:DUF6502 family protein [Variovorax sp. J31P207]|uniref:DUF6502 family protein n=1 Tax=Variovorax sp. J31P207 TaxID=3053510 RepID=UPI002579081F|nr:DUF6502 family protein [Variovorax sp. J31P207]MDM0070520.1 DUF6502 family protein [Variovorax sp. J31P207]